MIDRTFDSAVPDSSRRTAVRFERAVGWLAAAAAAVAGALVLGLVLLFAYEVVLRTFFNRGTGLADQVAAYAMPAITFLSLAYTLHADGHVKVDVLVSRLSARWQSRLELVTDALSLAVCAALTWYTALTVLGSYRDGTRSFAAVWTFPEYLPQFVMPIGLLLLALQMSLLLFRRRKRERDAGERERS